MVCEETYVKGTKVGGWVRKDDLDNGGSNENVWRKFRRDIIMTRVSERNGDSVSKWRKVKNFYRNAGWNYTSEFDWPFSNKLKRRDVNFI